MNRFDQIAASLLLVPILAALSLAQPNHSTYDPAAHPAPSNPPDSFLDFTLKHINPSEMDYGQCLSEGRRMLLEETAKNAYFWSNIAALSLLGCSLIVIVHQQRTQTRTEWATAEIVTQLEQSLARSRAQLGEATKKNCELRDVLTAMKESALTRPSLAPESAERDGWSAEKPRTTNAQAVSPTLGANAAKTGNMGSARSPVGKDAAQMRLFTPEPDFVMKLNSLEQQLAQSREDNKRLRRQIASEDRRHDTEKGKNRQLGNA